MIYIEAIITLFAIVDPIGNMPLFLEATEHVHRNERQKAFKIAVLVSGAILLIFSIAGNFILNTIFHIEMADVRIAGGILLLIIAINDLIFSSHHRPSAIHGRKSAIDIGCVPLACPLLAGPGAMVTTLATWKNPDSGPLAALLAIGVVLGTVWLITRYIEVLSKFLGKLIITAVSKVMLVFLAAIGVHMIVLGLKTLFNL